MLDRPMFDAFAFTVGSPLYSSIVLPFLFDFDVTCLLSSLLFAEIVL